jgi:uncharacterized protein (DUF488 family)
MIRLFTIGFAGKSAERFFQLLSDNGVVKIIDTRLKPSSQLSGFAKGRDLAYFAQQLGNIGYEHRLDFAPTAELLSAYRDHSIAWPEYERLYVELLKQRVNKNENVIRAFDNHCLLCSEHSPEHCHRRVLAEYLAHQFQGIEIIHLV